MVDEKRTSFYSENMFDLHTIIQDEFFFSSPVWIYFEFWFRNLYGRLHVRPCVCIAVIMVTRVVVLRMFEV